MSIFSVYIEEGCITCDACEEAAPDVFEVTDDTCFIKPDVRLDGGYDRNDGKSGLKPDVLSSLSDDILDAADACPVDVIIVVEGQAAELPEAGVETAPEQAEPEPESVPTEEVVIGEGVEELLTAGDRSLEILFGSQSGNSEELASSFAKQAKSYGMQGSVHDMDGFDFNSLSSKKRVLIVCSTWGEGEMPDNAEELWQFANSPSASKLGGVHFAVCALGDSSYEFYCQSGKDWDQRFEALGATRLVERVDCDVDYDAPAATWALEALPALAAVDGTGQFHGGMIDPIKQYVSGTGPSGAEGEDGFSLPTVSAIEVQAEISIFRYDPIAASTGTDTWICSLPGHMSILEALRTLKDTQDPTLTFRDGTADDPNTAICVNGRLILPGLTRIDSAAPLRNDSLVIRIEPLSGFDVIRDLAIDPWSLERKRESSKPWFVGATREGESTPQGPIGTMQPGTASELHSICDYQSQTLLHASSDAVPYANGYLGPAVIARSWARRNDPRTSPDRKQEIDEMIGSQNGIKAETDFAPIKRQESNPTAVSDALIDAKRTILINDSYTGRHGKHVWWYTWSVKSSGRVNDTVIYRQVLGPGGLLGNLFSGVTARMVLGFTRTGGNMFNGMLGMVAPPAGIGKMPKQFNSSIDKHHEVVAIFNELDGRF